MHCPPVTPIVQPANVQKVCIPPHQDKLQMMRLFIASSFSVLPKITDAKDGSRIPFHVLLVAKTQLRSYFRHSIPSMTVQVARHTKTNRNTSIHVA